MKFVKIPLNIFIFLIVGCGTFSTTLFVMIFASYFGYQYDFNYFGEKEFEFVISIFFATMSAYVLANFKLYQQ